MKKIIILIAVNALCLIAFIVCLVMSSSIRAPLRSQQAAAAWGGQSGERFSQVSVFFPETYGFDVDSVRGLRQSVDKALLAASMESIPGLTLYNDAWSTKTDVSIVSERGSTNATAFAVGGDFFMFHPLFLRDGSYLSPNDIMKDRVVIDEELAWRLFGGVRVSGFEMLINERPFIIAGVVSRENDFASSKAYTYGAGLFMSFDALEQMKEEREETVFIHTYEIVMPDPITGFALNVLTEAISDESVHIVENSTRFSLSNSFSAIRSFGARSISTDAITYPYWENAARIAEDWLALLLALSLIFIIFPVICAVIYGIKIIRVFIKHGIFAFHKISEEIEHRKYEKYKLTHGEDGEAFIGHDEIY